MKRAVVFFNLGGPDSPEAIRPFLFNLFNDPAIINLPQPFRWLLARRISGKRAPFAQEIYAHLGGRSPLLDLTRAQAEALETELGEGTRVFIAMRYWHPLTRECVAKVKAFAPDQVILLPLYPQFSTTTTGSSIKEWHRETRRAGLKVPTVCVESYPTQPGWIGALAGHIRQGLRETAGARRTRVLFSAHGLPKKIVDRGDPYPRQIEQTVAAVVSALALPELDWSLAYQSRVGRMEWIGPSTEDEIRRAGAEGVGLLVVPVAFVSEHSETLVELDIEYRHLAKDAGVPIYVRAPAVGTDPQFIAGLAALVRQFSL